MSSTIPTRTTTTAANNSQQQLRTLFPGGFKRPEIKVSTVVLKLSSEEILSRDQDSVAETVSSAVSEGVGVVVLKSGKGDDDSGGLLYEAACVLKSVVGDKAYLLICDSWTKLLSFSLLLHSQQTTTKLMICGQPLRPTQSHHLHTNCSMICCVALPTASIIDNARALALQRPSSLAHLPGAAICSLTTTTLIILPHLRWPFDARG